MPEYGTTMLTGLPEHVTLYEGGARGAVEVTSFVRPEWVPQLADAEELLATLGPAPEGIRMPVLVPNRRGLDRALAAGVREVAVFASATEAFARKNLNS